MNSYDLMVPDEIKADLGTKFLGNTVISYVQTGSTNDVAINLAAGGAKEGTLVVAESQTRGRGRRNRKWMAPMGTSILASLILRPEITIREAHIITLTSAAAIAQAIRLVSKLPVNIKWPNDVIVNNGKVSGVLTEMRLEKGRVDFLVVGIGVNVNIPKNRLPLEIRDFATSLSAELGHDISRIELLKEILRQLEHRYLEVKEQKTAELISEWKSLMVTLGQRVRLAVSGGFVSGFADDIDETGALLIRTDDEQIRRISADMDFRFCSES